MRVFKTLEADGVPMEKSPGHQAQKKTTKSSRPPRENLSANEIRSKVNEHFSPKPESDKVEVSKFAKVKNDQDHKKVEDSPEKELSKPSDVGLNDPNDPATVGKLKSVLSKGAFNFNPKEREALEKILSERD